MFLLGFADAVLEKWWLRGGGSAGGRFCRLGDTSFRKIRCGYAYFMGERAKEGER